MLASIFVVGGVLALRDPKPRAAKAQPVADALGKVAPSAPLSATNLVRLNGLTHLGAGLALATGRFPRASAMLLAATMPPTTLTGHQFWNEPDPATRTNQLLHFLKNLAITGGLLMATLDPDPHKEWIGRRAKNTAVDAGQFVADRFDSLSPS